MIDTGLIGIIIFGAILALGIQKKEDGTNDTKVPFLKYVSVTSILIPLAMLFVFWAYRNTDKQESFLIVVVGVGAIILCAFALGYLVKQHVNYIVLLPILVTLSYALLWIVTRELMVEFLSVGSGISFVFTIGIGFYKEHSTKMWLFGLMFVASVVCLLGLANIYDIDIEDQQKPVRLARELLDEEGYKVDEGDWVDIDDVDYHQPFDYKYFTRVYKYGEPKGFDDKITLHYEDGVVTIVEIEQVSN